MATDEATSLQPGTTPNPIASNSQDFSGSDDEILDNFAEGPLPGDPPNSGDPHDDGMPMGLGGEKGKQSEPASSTLEADIVHGTGTTKQPGETTSPPEESAGEPQPVQESAGETGAETTGPEPKSEEPETPDFPPALLQMAGYADADAAKAAGLGSPETLAAYVRGRGELLASARQPAAPSGQPLYGQRDQLPPTQPAPQAPEPKAEVEPEKPAEFKPFELSEDDAALLDEHTQDALRRLNAHHQQQFEAQGKDLQSLRTSLSERESDSAAEQLRDDTAQFDQAVQALGEEWQDIFGEGRGDDLMRASATDPVAGLAFKYRSDLFDTVQDVRADNAQRGLEPLNGQQELLYALMRRFPDKFQHTISGNSNGSSGQQRGVSASRPTQRNTPPKSQNAKVLSDVDRMLKKKGSAPLDMGHEEEFDGEL